MARQFNSEAEIEEVVRGFECCTTAKEQFTHSSHLTVAVWFLTDSTVAAATERMRFSLFRFLDHHHLSRDKYNETVTVFWMKVIQKLVNEMAPNCPLLEITNSVLENLGNSQLALEYYSKPLLHSDKAKQSWVEPDLRSL